MYMYHLLFHRLDGALNDTSLLFVDVEANSRRYGSSAAAFPPAESPANIILLFLLPVNSSTCSNI